jgi:rhodanese-related sulfurtransferase
MLTYQLSASDKKVVGAEELADWIISGRRDFVMLDMRDPASYGKSHIRGAQNCGGCHQNKDEGNEFMEQQPEIDLTKKIVFYTNSGKEEISIPKILHDNVNLYWLRGGYAAWTEQILGEVAHNAADDERVTLAKRKRNAVRNFFLGKVTTLSQVKVKVKPLRRVRPHGAAEDEGC